jgi:glycosyltransferase involved in cell wall biosynthesis
MSERIIFLPWVEAAPSSSERTPQLLSRLSQWYQVVPVRPGRFNQLVYDQGRPRVARYLLFILDEVDTFVRTLRAARREKVRLIFAEGTYFSLVGALVAKLRGIPLVWDNHANIRDFSAALGKSELFFRGNLLLERLLHSMSSAVLVVSEKEKEAYRELGFRTEKFAVVPTCVDLDALDQGMMPREESKRALGIEGRAVLFFGTLRYEPNLESALYISREMAPSLRERAPDAMVYLAGSGELGEAPSDGVRMLGFVPELAPWLSAADVCVAPTWRGVGILTKVIDMLSAGRATVVSPLALDGMPELEDGQNCLVGRDPEHFSRQVARLLEDEELRERLGRNGRRLVEERYCWGVVGVRLRRLLDDLMEVHDG